MKLLITFVALILPGIVMATEEVVPEIKGMFLQYKYMVYIASVAVAASSAAFAQSRAAAVALEGISRNPAAQGKIFVPMIISFALMESLVLITFVSIALTK